jgi:SecY
VTTKAAQRLEHARGAVIRRVLITLAALAVWRLGLAVPLPGIELSAVPQLSGTALARVSILALGLIPWLSAMALAELAVLLLPPSMTARIVHNGHADPLALPIVALALAFAAFQGYGIAIALEGVRNLVAEPGDAFRVVTSVTFVVGTAVVIALGRIIQSQGIGWGFWVLLAAQSIDGLAHGAVQSFAAILQGVADPLATVGVLAFIVAAIAAIVALLETRRKTGLFAAEPVIWPIQLYGLVIPWLAVGLQVLSSPLPDTGPIHTLLLPDRPLGALVMTLLIATFVAAYARRENGAGIAIVTAAALIAISSLALLARHFNVVYLPPAVHIVLIAAVGYVIVTTLQERWHGRAL